jgi:activator of 2-hydroxyglutaryl-CoA dehydratase
MTEEIIGRDILVPEYPQLTGAIGAALYAMGAVDSQAVSTIS